MHPLLTTFWRDETAQDLVEYSLLLAFIAITAMAVVITAGGSVKTIYTSINSQLTNAAAS